VENSVLDTVETATAHVIAELEAKGTATREDFDVAAIVAASHALSEGWDFRSIDRAVFWGLTADNFLADVQRRAPLVQQLHPRDPPHTTDTWAPARRNRRI
jgi:hypothetical protein